MFCQIIDQFEVTDYDIYKQCTGIDLNVHFPIPGAQAKT